MLTLLYISLRTMFIKTSFVLTIFITNFLKRPVQKKRFAGKYQVSYIGENKLEDFQGDVRIRF